MTRAGAEAAGAAGAGRGMPVSCADDANGRTPFRLAGEHGAGSLPINFADFEDASGRKLSIEIRAYDDGVAFRYMVPAQESLKDIRIERELTEFTFAKDAPLYPLIVDGFQSSYEDEYQMRHVSGIHHDWLIALPLLADVPGSGWVAVTEAHIENYAGMYLRKADARFGLRAELSPRIDKPGIAVEADAPVTTPWRVLMIGDEPGRLVESNIVLNLNPPSKIADTSWIKAGKSAWDWWSGEAAPSMSTKPGMNTATMKALHRLCFEVGICVHAD